MKIGTYGILFFTLASLFTLGCDRNRTSSGSRLKVQLPSQKSSKTVSLSIDSNLAGTTWALEDPQALSEINCYVVAVGIDESNSKNCYKSSGEIAFKWTFLSPGTPAGLELFMDVPSGPARRIYLVGLVSRSNLACQSLKPGQQPPMSDLSAPHLISQITMDLEPGEVTVDMLAKLDPLNKFDKCDEFGESSNPGTVDPVPGVGPAPDPTVLALSPPQKTLGYAANYAFTATGGEAPYTFTVISGSGTIDGATGAYVAPGNSETGTIQVTDALGSTATAQVKVVDVSSPDSTFGSGNGRAFPTISGYTDLTATSVRPLPDGKVIIGGYGASSSQKDMIIVRLLADGTLDSTFNSLGYVTFDLYDTYNHDMLFDLDVQLDGKIVFVGSRSTGTYTDAFIGRLNSDGSQDSTFSGNINDGLQFVDINGQSEAFYSVLIQPDGKILTAGYATVSDKKTFICRYLPDGNVDTSFAGSGCSLGATATNDYFKTLLVDPVSGSVFAAGKENLSLVIVKFDNTGALDSGFGTAGKFLYQSSAYDTEASSLAPAPDGDLLVGGYRNDGNFDGIILKVRADGAALDSNFAAAGEFIGLQPGNNDTIEDIKVQSDGKIVLVGRHLSTDNDWIIARLQVNGSMDTGWGSSGKLIYNGQAGGNEWDDLKALDFDKDGSIFAVGYANSSSGAGGVASNFSILKIFNDAN